MNTLLKKPKSNLLTVFLLGLLLSFLIFLPFLIFDKGLFLYFGDYDVQQIPFYRLCHDAIRNGQGLWNWNTDLGVNFIGSYSFYTLGSPFFWLTIPFPSEAVPYLMAPLLMLKFALTSVTGYALINRFTKTSQMAMIGGLLYAFSGFNIYNIFFNHFNEVVLVFPLLLIALEEFVINNRRGGFALAVALCAVMNYYFFFGEVIFCVIYFLIRLRSDDFNIDVKRFFMLFFESVIGLLLACVMLIPALLALTGNPRTGDTIEGYNTLVYGNSQRYGLILSSFFFPPDIPARPNFFPDSNAKWSSVSMFLPLFSMTGVFAFFREKKKHFFKTLLIICFAICFIPFLNAAFSAFNYGYYARWFYMPLLIMSLVTCVAMEDHIEEFNWSLKVTGLFVLLFTLIGIMPKREDGKLIWFSLPEYPERFWAYVLIAIFGLLCTWLLVLMTMKHKKFMKTAVICLFAITFTYSSFMLFCGKTSGHGYDTVYERGINGAKNLSLPKDEFYRIDSFDEIDNLGMFLNIPTINAFHSIVPSSVIDYYTLIGEERGVASRPSLDKIGIRALTSVKYAFVSEDKPDTSLVGFSYFDTQNGYKIYKNDNFVPMGVSFDYMLTQTQLEDAGQYKDRLLLKGLYLEQPDENKKNEVDENSSKENVQNQYKRYNGILPELADEDGRSNKLADDEDYIASCKKLASNTVTNFSYNSNGFTADYTADKDRFVFFSVPYDKGFTATVNGEETEILKANGGFMAVKVGKGENKIAFSYMTPGLKIGIIVSVAALILLLLYYLVILRLRKNNPDKYGYKKNAHRPIPSPSIDEQYIEYYGITDNTDNFDKDNNEQNISDHDSADNQIISNDDEENNQI